MSHSSAEYMREWRAKNATHIREYQKRWRENNALHVRDYARQHTLRYALSGRKADRAAVYRLKRRLKILTLYGAECVCCHEREPAFLAIDHIEGGGGQHRKSFRDWHAYENWLLEHKQDGIRILCHNCNMAIAYYKVCPHAH